MESQKKFQSIIQRINQSVRYYRVPSTVEKSAALNLLLEKIEKSSGRVTKSKSIWFYPGAGWIAGWAAAAVLAIAFILFSGRETFHNGTLHSAAYRLPDNSRVVLAPGTRLTFTKGWNHRKVRLVGEAYFEVLHGDHFQVRTSAGKVEVLGTRFSVKERGNSLEVECYEGSVRVANRKTGHVLQSGGGAVLSGEELNLTSGSERSYPSFALFRADYTNQEFSGIVKEIEDFFSADITIRVSGERYYTGSFETGNLEVALVLLCEPLGLNFRTEADNQIVIYQ